MFINVEKVSLDLDFSCSVEHEWSLYSYTIIGAAGTKTTVAKPERVFKSIKLRTNNFTTEVVTTDMDDKVTVHQFKRENVRNLTYTKLDNDEEEKENN